MVDKKYSYAGYGYVEIYEGSTCIGSYWVQNFSVANKYYEDGYDREHPENNKPIPWDSMTVGKRKDYTADFTAKVNPDILSLYAKVNGYEGEMPVEVSVRTVGWGCSCYLSDDQYDVKVLTPSICSYQNGKVKGLKAGKAKLLISLKADSSINTTVEFDIKDKPVKNGSSYTVSGNTYKVTSTGNKTVEFKNADDSQNSVSIPKTVKIKGKTYKVTAIAANAFKDNKKIKAVTIPANITKIGKNAFYGCKSLKKITVKTTKLTSSKVGKNAFKGIHKKAVIKVPGKKLGTYKKLLKAKGIGKSVKVKKS
ncbi:MAG: leucine-rich repeat domain-containing protein [Lachnospiraceae bacterium]|nr:leucine-rich repeat domain-containing protein [Lachnospiraceae bacterium]